VKIVITLTWYRHFKRTNNDQQGITHKTKDRVTQNTLKPGINSGAPEGLAVPIRTREISNAGSVCQSDFMLPPVTGNSFKIINSFVEK
jgi:hypothetical protein